MPLFDYTVGYESLFVAHFHTLFLPLDEANVIVAGRVGELGEGAKGNENALTK